MDRSNHYEAAFAALLQARRICHVAIDESRRSPDAGEGSLKSLDFIVHSRAGSRWLIDVKGRRFPSGSPRRPSRSFQNWTSREDVVSSREWTAWFGPGYDALFVFTYFLTTSDILPAPEETLFTFQDRRYLLRAVRTRDYEACMRPRSRRWGTVHLPAACFRQLARPLHHYLPELSGTQASPPACSVS